MRIRDITKKDGEFPDIKESASGGATSASNVASVANPMGNINRRPSLFGYIPYEEPEDKPKKTKRSRKRS
jgi:hypothetical protein